MPAAIGLREDFDATARRRVRTVRSFPFSDRQQTRRRRFRDEYA